MNRRDIRNYQPGPSAWRKLLELFGAVGLALACYAILAAFGSGLCGEVPGNSAASPDGSYMATVYTMICYMDGGVDLSVVIAAEPERQLLWLRPDRARVLALRETASGQPGNAREPDVSWLDARTVLLDYSRLPLGLDCRHVSTHLSDWRDVRIEYRGRCEPVS